MTSEVPFSLDILGLYVIIELHYSIQTQHLLEKKSPPTPPPPNLLYDFPASHCASVPPLHSHLWTLGILYNSRPTLLL